VAGDLVPGIDDAADEGGIVFRDPAQGEEGALHPCPLEQGEHGIGVALDAVGQAVPRIARDHLLKGADLEPVLDVDREGIEHGIPS
jgi:hypothetical protein